MYILVQKNIKNLSKLVNYFFIIHIDKLILSLSKKHTNILTKILTKKYIINIIKKHIFFTYTLINRYNTNNNIYI